MAIICRHFGYALFAIGADVLFARATARTRTRVGAAVGALPAATVELLDLPGLHGAGEGQREASNGRLRTLT